METGQNKMNKYYVTFGNRYRHEPHPSIYGADIHPDGWIEVTAKSYDDARAIAFTEFGSAFCFIYEEDVFKKIHFPRGCLFTIGI